MNINKIALAQGDCNSNKKEKNRTNDNIYKIDSFEMKITDT